ncbi:MAG: hypothetical protein ACXVXP_00075 [Mycobacteriaceae bacterium]
MQLGFLLREHAELLEADFARFYQRDLLDLWRGEMTPRKASVLAANLPPGALVWMALGYDAGWSMEALLLAAAVDAINGGNWQRSGGKGPQPKPVPRPSDLMRQAQQADRMAERAAAFLARKRDRESQTSEQ